MFAHLVPQALVVMPLNACTPVQSPVAINEILTTVKSMLHEIKLKHRANRQLTPPVTALQASQYVLEQSLRVHNLSVNAYAHMQRCEQALQLLNNQQSDWWICLCLSGAARQWVQELCHIKLMHAVNRECLSTMSHMLQLSVFYPGYTFGCTGTDDCPLAECRKQQLCVSQCPIFELGAYTCCSWTPSRVFIAPTVIQQSSRPQDPDVRFFTAQHRSWTVVAVTQRGRCIWVQSQFERQHFRELPASEFALRRLTRTGQSDVDVRNSWVTANKIWGGCVTETTSALNFADNVMYHMHPHYRSGLLTTLHHYRLLEQMRADTSVSPALQQTPRELLFCIAQYAAECTPEKNAPLYPYTLTENRYTTHGVPNWIQAQRFLALAPPLLSEMCTTGAEAVSLGARRQVKRKRNERNDGALGHLGGDNACAQACEFAEREREYAYETWVTAGKWGLAPCLDNRYLQNANAVPVRSYLMSLAEEATHSIALKLAWTPQRRVFMVEVVQFTVRVPDQSSDNREAVPLSTAEPLIQAAQESARHYVYFLKNEMHAIREPGTGIWYIAARPENTADQVYRKLAQFLQSRRVIQLN